MKNVTVTLDEDTVAWARVEAARQNVSLSRLLGEILEERMRTATAYEDAMRTFLGRAPVRLSKGQERPYPAREDVNDRAGLR
jgi:hypothetical protein